MAKTRTLWILAASALALRLAALWLQGPNALDWDAANYARIAQNMHDGIGNVTLRGVPNVLHAPLYPLLVAALLFVIRSPQIAGIVISLASGTLLVVSIYRLTEVIGGAEAALVAGGLAAVHPVLVAASIAPLSEALFMALVLTGLDILVRALQRPSYPALALAGLCFGCAYVTREEGLAYEAIGAVAMIAAALCARTTLRTVAARLTVLLLPFALCAAPYVAFLAHATGHVALESKSVLNYAISNAIRHGDTYVAAADGIGPNLEDVGVELGRSYPFSAAQVPPPTARDRVQLALVAAPHHLVDVVRTLGGKRNGGALFLLFALVGAVWQLRSRTWGYGLVLAACLLAEFAALLSVNFFWDRFAQPFAALLLPWTACGIVLVARWAQRMFPALPAARVAAAGWALAAFTGVALYALGIATLRRNANDPALFMHAGAWIADRAPRTAIVMAVDPLTAYYGDATWRALPYADGPTALRYIASRAPAFVVVGTLTADRPYLAGWLAGGIPDPTARLVFEERRGADAIFVYCWRWLPACATLEPQRFVPASPTSRD